MKKAKNGGYSLVEVLVAIALLAIITIPTYTCLVLSVRLNAKTDEMLKAQLAVSSAVETLMAEKLTVNGDNAVMNTVSDNVDVDYDAETGKVTVSCGSVSVTTYIPKKEGSQ